MGIYRIARSMVVDALQCNEEKTIATDMGFINVKKGDWVVCGESGETYIVDDAYFQRTFITEDDSRHPLTEDAEQQSHLRQTAIQTTFSPTGAHRKRTRSKLRAGRRRTVRSSR